ncbi:MAG TPA: hypothetical protein VFI23_08455 [Rhizomicrobium sp.]|nr:hypothetical protein [Rhizomicrobium sp.]
MSEEKERAESGTEAAGIDHTAVALALGGASRLTADAFLNEQRALISDQRHHLHEQLQQLHLSIFDKWLGVLLRVATLCVGIAAASGVGLMIWDAAHSNGLIIEAFNVPPDLAAKGMTGEVVAAKVLDELVVLQSKTNSGRPAKSYANSWGEHGIKLEIPETGISLNELDNWLREKLGHDSRLSGELVRGENGITLTARSDNGAVSVSGAEKDINELVVKLAEQVYRVTQPFRYGMYLTGANRLAEALPVFEALAKSNDKEDRMWGYARWALTVDLLQGADAAYPLERQALAEDPGNIGVYDSLANYYGSKGRSEDGLQNTRTQLAHLLDGKQTYVSAARLPGWEKMLKARIDGQLDASHDAAQSFEELVRSPVIGIPSSYFRVGLAGNRLSEHDMTGARAVLADLGVPNDARTPANLAGLEMAMVTQSEDWGRLLALTDADLKNPNFARFAAVRILPLKAFALAKLGRFDAAERQISGSSAVCYGCLRIRAQIAELQHQTARADFWFARATSAGPSLPFADEEWGRALLGRSQADGAIAQFAIANKKSPHFADPLEGWGEALMAKNQSHLALAKFAEAEKYAPNWGRLHLKWGEALAYAGKRNEAKAQFARAAQLDLTPFEKSELSTITAGMRHV